jgi:hypothetical protein
VDHDARMEAFVSRVREKVQAEARWQQLQKDQTKGVSTQYFSLSEVGEMLCLDVFGKIAQGCYFEVLWVERWSTLRHCGGSCRRTRHGGERIMVQFGAKRALLAVHRALLKKFRGLRQRLVREKVHAEARWQSQ